MKILSVMTFDPSAVSGPPTQQDFENMDRLIAEMRDKGVLVDTGGHTPGMLQLKVARKNGNTTVTDGPFTEAKEIVGGFGVLEVKDREEAITWTNRFLDLVGNATCTITEIGPTP